MPTRTRKQRPSMTDDQKKWRARIVMGLAVFMAACGPIALVMVFFIGHKPAAPPPPGFSYQGSASLVAQAWVAAEPSPIPVAKELEPYLGRSRQDPLPVHDLAWKSARFIPFNQGALEAHRFSATMNGLSMEITVVIMGDSNNNPVVMSIPTLLPTKTLPGLTNMYLNYESVGPHAELTTGALKQLKDWGKAYVADDRDGLYKATGDAQTRIYRGIPGKNKLTVDPAVLTAVTGPNGVIAHVRLTIRPEGWPADSNGFPIEMDVLYGPFDREVPYIVAWGAAGDGASLTPYINGFTPAGQPETPPGTARPGTTGTSAPKSTTTTAAPTTTPTTAAPTTTVTPSEPPPSEPTTAAPPPP